MAFASFIAHGFLDFWPLCKKWDWTLSLPYYLIVSISTIYLYSVYPLFIQLLFYIGSAYHFGSDWRNYSEAFFLGNVLVGIGLGCSLDILQQLDIQNSKLLSIVSLLCGAVSFIPSFKKPSAIFMVLIGLTGLHGVMLYSIFIHTPRSVYLLADKYGYIIYSAWIILTFITFIIIVLSEVIIDKLNLDSNILIGLMYGILFAHIICTSLWRKITDNILLSFVKRYCN
jgi:hypothetical protein